MRKMSFDDKKIGKNGNFVCRMRNDMKNEKLPFDDNNVLKRISFIELTVANINRRKFICQKWKEKWLEKEKIKKN